MSNVLHHVPDWQAGLAEASRVLAAEAVLAVTLGPGPPPPGEAPARRAQLLAWAEDELRLLRPGRRKPLQQMTTLRAVEEVDAALVGTGFGRPTSTARRLPARRRRHWRARSGSGATSTCRWSCRCSCATASTGGEMRPLGSRWARAATRITSGGGRGSRRPGRGAQQARAGAAGGRGSGRRPSR